MLIRGVVAGAATVLMTAGCGTTGRMDLVLDVVGWVHVSGGRLLAVRACARDWPCLPGGQREAGEDDWMALPREADHDRLAPAVRAAPELTR